MSPPLVVVFLKIQPKCTSQIGQSRVCGSMIAITINVQIATTIQPVARSQRAPRSPPSSTDPSSSEQPRRDAARTTSARRTPNWPPPATDADSSGATPSSIRVSDTIDSMPGLEPRLASLRPQFAEERRSAQLGTRASSRTSPSVMTPVSSCQLFASHRAQRWNTTSRPAIRIRIVIERAFCTSCASVHWWPPCRVTRGSSARSVEELKRTRQVFPNPPPARP